MNEAHEQTNLSKSVWSTVTPFSKYLALFLFITMPFIGGWVGYHYAPKNIVDVEVTKVTENIPDSLDENRNLVPLEESTLTATSCDNQVYSLAENTPFADLVGLNLPTFAGHIWQETSAGHTFSIWQECPSAGGSRDYLSAVNVSVRNYLIPDDCDPREGEYGKLVCSNSDSEILGNGSEGFSDLLLKEYTTSDQNTFLGQLESVVPSYLFSNDDEYFVVMIGPERSITLRFQKELRGEEFVAAYVKSIEPFDVQPSQ